MKTLLLIASALLLVTGCKNKNGQDFVSRNNIPKNALVGVVLETMDVPGYTYVRVKTDSNEAWAAVPQTKTAVNDTVILTDPMAMKGYESKSLNRTFESIYFAGALTSLADWRVSHSNAHQGKKGDCCPMEASPKSAHPKIETEKVDVGAVEKAAGGVTLSTLFASMDAYKGKTILVRGKVVKANYGILDKTWLHIQDGSGDDLTVTTTATTPKKGDMVLIKGVFATDKDLGMGYQFKGIVEDAQVTLE